MTLGPASKRLLEQWDALFEYIIYFLPNNKSPLVNTSRYKRIKNCLTKNLMKATLHFVVDSSEIFQHFSYIFQKSEPLIHLLHDELYKIFIILSTKICKKNVSDFGYDIDGVFSSENLLNYEKIEIPGSISKYLKSCKPIDIAFFKKMYRDHFHAAATYLWQHLNKETLKLFKHFKYMTNFDSSSDNIVEISKYFSLDVNYDLLTAEWNTLKSEESLVNHSRIDHFWSQIFLMKSGDRLKYPICSKIIRMCLVVFYGNSDVERGFSVSRDIISEDKTSMSLKMLNARLHIKEGLKKYDNRIENIEIDDKLLIAASLAHKKYLLYLEEEKTKKHEEERRVKLQKENDENILKGKEDARKEEQSILLLEKDIEDMKKKRDLERTTITRLVSEANIRLTDGIKKNDITEIKIAQSMLDSVQKSEEAEKRIDSDVELNERSWKRKMEGMAKLASKKTKK